MILFKDYIHSAVNYSCIYFVSRFTSIEQTNYNLIQRLHFAPKQKRTVTFQLPVKELAFWDVTRSKEVVESGDYTIMIGRSSEDIEAKTKLKVKGEVIADRDPYQDIRAENYDDYQGVIIDEDRETGGNSVAPTDAGGWIAFKDMDFASGASRFEARVSSTSGAQIEVRLDSPTGDIVSTAAVPATGGAQEWTTVSSAVYGASKVRDVYLTFTKPMNVSQFRFDQTSSPISLKLDVPAEAAAGKEFKVGLQLTSVSESVYKEEVTLQYDQNLLGIVGDEKGVTASDTRTVIEDVRISSGKIVITLRHPAGITGSAIPTIALNMKVKNGKKKDTASITLSKAVLEASGGKRLLNKSIRYEIWIP